LKTMGSTFEDLLTSDMAHFSVLPQRTRISTLVNKTRNRAKQVLQAPRARVLKRALT
jgi:hypothetical protein